LVDLVRVGGLGRVGGVEQCFELDGGEPVEVPGRAGGDRRGPA
jgi:hypothetical protein